MSLHQVRRARFQLKLGASQEARPDLFPWQRRFENEITDLLAKVCDNWQAQQGANHNQVIEVKQIQLDLGLIPEKPDARLDIDSLVPKLTRQLTEQLQSIYGTSGQQWQLHCYLHFLRTGSWPIGSPFKHTDEVESHLSSAPVSVLEGFKQAIGSQALNASLFKRLYYQHSGHFVSWLVECWIGKQQQHQLRDHLSRWGMADDFIPTCLLALYLSDNSDYLLAPKKQDPDKEFDLVKDGEAAVSIEACLDLLATRLKSLPTSSKQPTTERDKQAEPDDKELDTILVEQAGIVLLHPFLADLFNRCGWLKDNAFVDNNAQLQALFALHFAATGSVSAHESSLLLEKFLIGLPLNLPIPAHISLAQGHKAHINELLEAVIGHWSALKNTSVQGLREAFLQRNGSLQPQEEGYRLSIESKGVDILLSRLPWSLEWINLPWLKQPLFVSWS